MQLWMSRFITSQCDQSAKGVNGVRFTRIPSVETTSTFWSGFWKVQTMPYHTMPRLIVRLSGDGWRLADIARITGVTQGCPTSSFYGKLFSRARTMPYTDFSTSSAPPSVFKTPSCLGHSPPATLYLHRRVRIWVASHRWTSSGI